MYYIYVISPTRQCDHFCFKYIKFKKNLAKKNYIYKFFLIFLKKNHSKLPRRSKYFISNISQHSVPSYLQVTGYTFNFLYFRHSLSESHSKIISSFKKYNIKQNLSIYFTFTQNISIATNFIRLHC